MSGLKVTELVVFVLCFAGVTIIGFVASKWQPARTMDHLDEWGLGGRKFGPWVTWFVVGGDIYTANAFIAVPALMFVTGASAFFVMPYLLITFPLVFLPLIRLWSVSRVRGYVTPADFVRGRYGSPTLALLIAITGIVATMPYIALQLIGLEAVIRTMGLNSPGLLGHLPLVAAFFLLALCTYQSGLRAPALMAFVKDTLIFLVAFVAILYLPIKLGGWATIFGAAEAKFEATETPADGLLLNGGNQLEYATLALGFALALFLYPHTVTGAFAARDRNVIKRNMSALPAYTLVLGLLLLLGYAAIAAGVRPLINNANGRPDNNTVIPLLFDLQFPNWFTGLAFATIAIAALVPAAVMSIGAANLWARSIYREYLHRYATPAQEARQAKIASLVVKLGAVSLVVFLDPQYSLDFQLIGGVIVLQTLPAVVIALYTRWLHVHGLIFGWLAGMSYAGYLLYNIKNPATGRPFAGSAYPLGDIQILGWHPFAGTSMTIYVGFVALLVNLVVAVVITVIARTIRVRNGRDETTFADYYADDGDPMLRPVGVS